ncbi:MAG: transcriptional regulator [Aquificaceae bacterium]|nr:transcriptional regulator [Aquificaceae bacterium]MDW8033114.1 transcriptional regulator [Aquificaceae bacterium]
MKSMKKVEVVVDSVYLSRALEILEKSGVSGYTVIRDVLGKGERGLMSGDEPTDVFKNSYIFTVCEEKTALRVAEEIKPLLKKVGGLCLLSDVVWIPHR